MHFRLRSVTTDNNAQSNCIVASTSVTLHSDLVESRKTKLVRLVESAVSREQSRISVVSFLFYLRSGISEYYTLETPSSEEL